MRSPARRSTGRAAPLLLLATVLLAACATAAPTGTAVPPPTATIPAPADTPTALPTATATRAATARATATTAASPRPSATARATAATAPPRATPTGPGSPAASPPTYTFNTATARFRRAGLGGTDLLHVATAASDPNLIFAGGAGLWRSTDAGRTWTAMRTARQAPRVSALAIAASDKQTAYVGVGEGCAKGNPLPGWVTTNGGGAWRETASGITDLAVDPKDAKHVYATTCTGPQESRDSGATWKPVPGAGVSSYDAVLLALAPSDSRVLYVVSVSEGGTARVRRSGDGGATWRDASAGAKLSGPLSLAVDATDPNRALLSTFQGLYLTTDAGVNWRQATRGLESTVLPSGQVPLSAVTAVVADPTVSGRYWLGSDATLAGGADMAVFMSVDRGASWRSVAPGLQATSVRGLALSGAGKEQRLFAATDDGVWVTRLP